MAKREQSATEFLTTYGFVILIIVIAVALLFVLSMSKSLLPTSCYTYGTVGCRDIAYVSNSMGSTVVLATTLQIQGILNVSGFSADVGGVESTGGYCSANTISGGATQVAEGTVMYCVATLPPSASSSTVQLYSGTFNITGTYCPSLTSSCLASTGQVYRFTGSFRTYAVAAFVLTATTAPTTTSSSSSSSSTSTSSSTSSSSSSSSSSSTSTSTSTTSSTTTISYPPSTSNMLYMVNPYYYGTLYIVDLSTNTLVKTLQPGGTSAFPVAVAFNPSGTTAYIVNLVAGDVSVMDVATMNVVNTIPVGSDPTSVSFNPSGTLAYVTNGGSDTVSVINVAANSVVKTISFGQIALAQIAVDPSPNIPTAFVIGYTPDSLGPYGVYVVNTITNTVSNTVIGYPSGFMGEPVYAAFNPSGTSAYISEEAETVYYSPPGWGQISVVNALATTNSLFSGQLQTGAVAGSSSTGIIPLGIAFDQPMNLAYVTYAEGNKVGVVDTASDRIVGTVTLTYYGPSSVAFNPSGTLAYIEGPNSNSIDVVDVSTSNVVSTIDAIPSDTTSYGSSITPGDYGCEYATPPYIPLFALFYEQAYCEGYLNGHYPPLDIGGWFPPAGAGWSSESIAVDPTPT